jgi:hypothetical protein
MAPALRIMPEKSPLAVALPLLTNDGLELDCAGAHEQSVTRVALWRFEPHATGS